MKFSRSILAVLISVLLCFEFFTTLAMNKSDLSIPNAVETSHTYISASDSANTDFQNQEVFVEDLSSDTPLAVISDEKLLPCVSEDVETEMVNNILFSAESTTISYKVTSFLINTSSHTVVTKVEITNNTSTNVSFDMHSALYSSLGAMRGYNVSNLSLAPKGTQSLTVTTQNVSQKEVSIFKLFFWDENMCPLIDSFVKTFTYEDSAQSIEFSNPTPVINFKFSPTYQLSCTVTPSTFAGYIIYDSLSPDVATVDQNGLVTAKKDGVAIITATTSDGAASAQCTLTVNNDDLSVTLNREIINMWNGYTYQLIATTAPVTGMKVSYVSSDTSVLTVSSTGLITAKSPGFATVSAFCDNAMSACMVSVYNEADYIGTVAAKYESNGDPGRISSGSGDAGGKSYGAFQFSSASNVPKSFYNWLISSGFNAEIGNALKNAHTADGGANYSFGSNFDAMWKQIAAEAPQEFSSAQLTYTKAQYYDPLFNKLIKSTSSGGLGFNPNNYGIALKSALFSRALQHGVTGAFNRIKEAFTNIGGFSGKTERQLIAAIYAECGATVTTPPSANSIVMNSSSSIAVQYGLVGKYMKYYSLNSSSIQASVWRRLNVNEPNDLYALLDNPPIDITPQD